MKSTGEKETGGRRRKRRRNKFTAVSGARAGFESGAPQFQDRPAAEPRSYVVRMR
jgi:hypothetical protein